MGARNVNNIQANEVPVGDRILQQSLTDCKRTGETEYVRYSPIDRLWFRSPQNPAYSANVGDVWFHVSCAGIARHTITENDCIRVTPWTI